MVWGNVYVLFIRLCILYNILCLYAYINGGECTSSAGRWNLSPSCLAQSAFMTPAKQIKVMLINLSVFCWKLGGTRQQSQRQARYKTHRMSLEEHWPPNPNILPPKITRLTLPHYYLSESEGYWIIKMNSIKYLEHLNFSLANSNLHWCMSSRLTKCC